MQRRRFPFEAADGPWNMAFDQWMLEAALRDPPCLGLRLYGWSPATLSLGAFQRWSEVEGRWTGVPIVRRASGGGAIWHDRDLTYAIAVPPGHPWSRQPRRLYRLVHEVIAETLDGLGLAARRRGEAEARTSRDRPFLCFLDRDAEDLVIAGSKVLGSAQRRKAGALLQHGSLLLAGSEPAPELLGLADRGVVASTDPAFWAERIEPRLIEALGGPFDERPPTTAERGRIRALAETVYAQPSWTERR